MSVSVCEGVRREEGGGGGGGGAADAALKTKTPHVNVGKKKTVEIAFDNEPVLVGGVAFC